MKLYITGLVLNIFYLQNNVVCSEIKLSIQRQEI